MTIQSDIQAMSNSLQQFVAEQSRINDETRKQHEYTSQITKDLRKYEDGLSDTIHTSERQQKIIKSASDIEERRLKTLRTIEDQEKRLVKINATLAMGPQPNNDDLLAEVDMLQTAIHNNRIKSNELQNIRDRTQQKLDGSLVKLSGHFAKFGAEHPKMTNAISDISGGFVNLLGPLKNIFTLTGLFGVVLGQTLGYLELARKVSEETSGVISGGGKSFDQAMTDFTSKIRFDYKLDPKHMAALDFQTRQMTNSMGGFDVALQNITKEAESQTMRYGGDRNKAYEETLKIQQQLKNLGFNATSKSVHKFNNSLDDLAAYGFKDAKDALYDLSGDSSSQRMFKNLRDGEREALFDSQKTLLLFNSSLGMSNEQAKAAAKSLQQIAGEKPMDRFKKAFKTELFANMIGQGAAGRIFREESLKGAKADQKKLGEAASAIGTAYGEAEGTYGMMGSMSIYAAGAKLGMDDQFGDGSPFSTTLVKNMAMPLERARESYTKSTEGTIKEMSDAKDKLDNLVDAMKEGTAMMWGLSKILKNFSIFGFKSDNVQDRITNTQQLLDDNNKRIEARRAKGEKDTDYMMSRLLTKNNELNKRLVEDKREFFQDQKYNVESSTQKIPVPLEPPKQTSEELTRKRQNEQSTQQSADNSTIIADKTIDSSKFLESRVQQGATTNDYLKTLVDKTNIMIDLSTKTVAAISMSDQERSRYSDYLRRSGGNNLSAEYLHAGS